MKILKTLSLIMICSILFTMNGCKKYPDGPLISLRTRTHRLIGTWDVESYSVNGIDSTGNLKGNLYYGFYEFKPEQNGVGISFYHSNYGSGGGHWYFENRQKNLRITITNSPPSLSPYAADDVTWEIRRLKEKELWLKTIYNAKEYFLKLKQ